MVSVVNIYNQAILHLGTGKTVSSTSDDSAEARYCNVFYEQARDELLSAGTWGFATKIADAQLVEEEPNDEWAYSYLYPSDALTIRRVLSGSRRDTRQTEIPFRVMNIGDARVIVTDEQNAQIEYTMRVTDTALFPVWFVASLSLALAAKIAPGLTEGDRFKMKEFVLQLQHRAMQEALSHSFNEEVHDMPPEAESIRERGTF
jgi:hypothetical protein